MGGPVAADSPAWEVSLNDFHPICFASTKAAAQWIAVSAWREAGFGGYREWPWKLSAHRRPDLDGFPLKESRAFSEVAVRFYL